MQLALLLTRKNSSNSCFYFYKYILEFINNDIEVVLFCESENDFEYMYKKSDGKFTVLYIYSEISKFIKNKNNNFINNKNIFKIDSTLKVYEKKIDINKYLEFYFLTYCKKNKIKYASLNFADGVFFSYSAVYFNKFCKKYNIKFLFPFPTPANGRFIIYDSIFLNSNKFNERYNRYLINEKNNNNKKVILSYMNDYKLFEQNLISRKNRFKSNYKFLQFFKNYIKFFLSRNFRYFKKIIYKKDDKPYILYMLTKSNSHWFTNYANPELTNRIENIKYLHKSIPINYNLVLKFHPRISFDKEIELFAMKHNNIKVAYEINNINMSYELIKNADLIIGYGSTSLMHPLFQYKKVIDVGVNSTYFNFKNPPVKRINNFKNISREFIEECINDKIDKHKIHSYFNSLLKTSHLFTDDSSKISDYKPMDKKYIIADKLIKIIKYESNLV